MTKFFMPSPPKMPKETRMPTQDDASRIEEERRKAAERRKGGRESTILAGGGDYSSGALGK